MKEAQTMAAILENPITRERIVVHEVTPERLRIEEQVAVDAIPPPVHVHMHQRERFEVIDGQVTVELGGEQAVLGPGEAVVAEPRVPHTWHNSGDGELRMLTEFTPAGNMLSFFETYCGFAQSGRASATGAPPFLQIAASCKHWDMYLAAPPVPLQKALFALLGPLARLRGYRVGYDEFRV
jgi:mannose-6-phosphate isomerase-like protein (cupin superfamily)